MPESFYLLRFRPGAISGSLAPEPGTMVVRKTAPPWAGAGKKEAALPLPANSLPHGFVSEMNTTIERVKRIAQSPAPVCEWTDEDLLLAYQDGGGQPAFDELVRRYERELYNYLRRYLGDEQLAEDTFQLTFLQVHLKCDQFEPGRKVRPWLYAVATNQAIDIQRRNRRHRMMSLDRRTGDREDRDSASLVEMLDSKAPGPAARFDSAEQGEVVRGAVDGLPESLRQVVMLVYYQGLKYREAAEVLSIPVGTVKSRLHAAIQKLSEALTPTEPLAND